MSIFQEKTNFLHVKKKTNYCCDQISVLAQHNVVEQIPDSDADNIIIDEAGLEDFNLMEDTMDDDYSDSDNESISVEVNELTAGIKS